MAATGDPRVLIDDGISAVDLQNEFGFLLANQTNIFDAPAKQREIITYAEADGEETSKPLNNKKEAFDYELEFIYYNEVGFDFNERIQAFKLFVADKDNLQIRNTYTNTKMLGYYKDLQISTFERKIYDSRGDFQTFKVIFRVPKPSSCNFVNVQ